MAILLIHNQEGRNDMTRKWLSLALIVLIYSAIMHPMSTWAAKSPSYSLIAGGASFQSGDEIEIAVGGRDLADVFAFELVVEFDAKRLRFQGAKSEIAGFSVSPIVEGNRLTFAHTKIGNVTGNSGDLTFLNLKFTAAGEGIAAIRLVDVTLINSKLEKTEHSSDERVFVAVGDRLFSDMTGHWAEANVKRAALLGIVSGYEDGSFRPEREVTRTQFVAMLARALRLPGGNASGLAFSDLEQIPAWARASVSAAVKANLIHGYEDNSFRGDNPITRSEMAAIMVRAFGTTVSVPKTKLPFADADQIPAYAREAVAAAADLGLMQGKGENRFHPKDNATRAEAVTIIVRLLDLKKVTLP